ncbi:MAG: N-acetylmuramoyl-L-alanine amidase [Oleispira antarctica]|uniref:N-acetylmuramoyl-L-alanine amidase AmiC n=1 Tax=Oleispira antarctica RB-8 TaxID=698738 RepID=R4YRN4_OLEAN|nr:N-acetylmuramoyl-L-alanine amidase [Oleispira antarctica]MBQ0792776.1 N-acetylmuramoyl-L-alanine amidase [Oleispira antarctica]CCK77752.1 N-acetylmuramoyl-L-alanine amidase [Oleispira antarctica RB-8]
MKKIIAKIIIKYLVPLVLVGSALNATADVDGVRVWQSPAHTRLVFDLSEPHQHKIFTLDKPYRVVIDLAGNAQFKPDASKVDLDSTLVTSLRTGRQKNHDLRIVFQLRDDVSPKSSILPPNKIYPHHRLVVDLIEKNATRIEPIKTVKTVADKVVHNKRDIIVAIDAGHGGEDPGAVGYRRTKEKTVVLKIAKKLANLLEKEPGYKPYLTRTGDYYIPLRDRTRKARDANADLFISIHADAFRNSQAHGSSVFVLSERGASSEEARYLAEKENEADLVGGVSLGDKDDHVAMTLLDLSMTATRGSSLSVGTSILKRMDKISRLHKKEVGEAAFMVLKAPDIPALLIETGFISNPGEAKKLATSSYQNKMAREIFNGLTEYFNEEPPEGSYIAWKKRGGNTSIARSNVMRSYTIRRGDTLSHIAKKHKVSITDIRRLNGIKNNRIQVGQEITLPAS